MRPIRVLVLLLLFVVPAPPVVLEAQPVASSAPVIPERWRQGYVRSVSGETLVYPWAYPGQTPTLLSRATDGHMTVEWEGEPLPAGAGDELVSYLWHAGLNAGLSAGHRFTLAVNGRPVVTFMTRGLHDVREWPVVGEDGATLSFRETRVGPFDELFGFMWITAPRRLFGDGAPRFSVTGEAAGSQDYYLGAEAPVETWTRVRPEEAIFADGQRVLRVEFSNVGPERRGEVRSGTRVLWSGRVEAGYTGELLAAGTPGDDAKEDGAEGRDRPRTDRLQPVSVLIDGVIVFEDEVRAGAVPQRTLHLLPHSHVDIGYSDPQPEVERKQWTNLRDAVALGAETASYPPGARFKWNVEGLWSVESYLRQATPQQRDAFAAAVRAGTIGIQANYTNILTGLATPEELHRWTDAHARLHEEYGIEGGRSAMHSDIPGLSWAVVSALASAGVRYFTSGPNYMPSLPDGGDRIGATLEALGDKPFWWTSPSGEERVLFWMAGRGYSWFHGLNTGRASERGRDSILEYARSLTEARYPYDMVQVRYTVGGDNGPVDRGLPAFVKQWNERFASPRLVIDTADAMFAEFERRHGASLPVLSGDMTPYWEDGALSTAAEEAMVRAAVRRLRQAETLAVLRGVRLPAAGVGDAWRSALLWHEHTWGAGDSIKTPDRPDVVAQWEYKRAFAVEADRSSRELLGAASPAAAALSDVEVINTLSWRRSGLVLLPPGLSRAGDRVLAGSTVAPSQRLRDGRLAVWVTDVPALSSLRLRIAAGTPAAPRDAARVSGRVLENGRVRIALDAGGGGVESLTWSGIPSHEFVAAGPEMFGYLYVEGRDAATATTPSGGTLAIEDAGPLVATVRVDGAAGGSRSSFRRFTVVAGSDRVFAEVHLEKIAVRSKESGHLAFPFAVPGGTIRADEGEAVVEIARDQLPGSCRDFIGVQSAIDVSGPSLGMTLVSLDAPLIEIGAITDERQPDGRARTWRGWTAPGTTLYAYLFNNYWHTNYKADQSGPLTFRFVLAPHLAYDPVALRRLSDEQDLPLLPVAAGPADRAARAPFLLEGDPVVVSSLRTDARGEIAVRLYNPSDEARTLNMKTPGPPERHQGSGSGEPTSGIRVGPAFDHPEPSVRLTMPPHSIRIVTIAPR